MSERTLERWNVDPVRTLPQMGVLGQVHVGPREMPSSRHQCEKVNLFEQWPKFLLADLRFCWLFCILLRSTKSRGFWRHFS